MAKPKRGSNVVAVPREARDRVHFRRRRKHRCAVGNDQYWRGSVLSAVYDCGPACSIGLMHPGTPPPQDDVLSSRVLSRGANSLHVYIRLVRHAIVTVLYDTEHDMSSAAIGDGWRRRKALRRASRKLAEPITDSSGGSTRTGDTSRRLTACSSSSTPSLSAATYRVRAHDCVAARQSRRRESTYRTLDALRRYFETSGTHNAFSEDRRLESAVCAWSTAPP